MHKTIAETTIQQLIRSPRLALYVQQFQSLLEAEREERKRFYEEVPESQKAEFINGEIIVHSPVRKKHNEVLGLLYHLLDLHVRKNKLGFVGHEMILITLTRNDYEPDICFFAQSKAQTFTPDQVKFPAPDFVVEILSPATQAIDRGIKFDDYAAHSIREYWIIDPHQENLEQYVLRGDEYELLFKAKTGIIESAAVDGFAIPVRAIFDEVEQFDALRKILG